MPAKVDTTHAPDEVSVLRQQLNDVREAVKIRCCHVTGLHDPTHFEERRYVCERQMAQAYLAVRIVLKMDPPTPEEATATPGCGWCEGRYG